ncbi:MAG TPA: transcriptional repressor [Trueperaceae bacterium]|nr:transcriptional repressor [Trueperaceae bacterium]
MTPLSMELLRVLAEATAPLTAREILSELRLSYPHVGFDSVYRNLFVLANCGTVNQLNLQNRDAARFELQDEHHHHAICLACGTVVRVDACPTTGPGTALPEIPGFRPTNHVFEIYGYCGACQQGPSS